MEAQYEVLNPWAEVDLIAVRGISPRIADLSNKTIGIFCAMSKRASRPILVVVERKLKERLPTLKFSWFEFGLNREATGTADKERFEEWLKGVDTAIYAVGD
jgi:hypothetical protein